jgi:hypothetical protein
MTLSFDNLPPVIAGAIKTLTEKAPNESGVFCHMDDGIDVDVKMKRAFHDRGVPEHAAHSAYKAVKDTAIVTIEPPNEELTKIISKYFLSVTIPAMMGAPERPFFDEVTINGKRII